MKKKYFFCILLLVIGTVFCTQKVFFNYKLCTAYCQQAQEAAQSIENHVESMLYNLDVYKENCQNQALAISAINMVHLHAVLLEEDVICLQNYCNNYSKASLTNRLIRNNHIPEKHYQLSKLSGQLISFQSHLENMYADISCDDTIVQTYKYLHTAQNTIEHLQTCISENTPNENLTPEQIVDSFYKIIDEMYAFINE